MKVGIFNYFRFNLYSIKKKIKEYFSGVFWEDNIDNLYYGHYHILKKYSKSVLPYKIIGEIQHGWNPGNGIPGDISLHNIETKKKKYYLWNNNNINRALNDGFENVTPIGAPFIYLFDFYKPRQSVVSNSLILFPLHSAKGEEFFDIISSYKKYINQIKRIEIYFQKISVAIYWKDFKNKQIVKLFNDQSISVYCLGHMDQGPKFLKNFIDVVGKYDYVTSDTYSSALFYSLYMGKKGFIYGDSMLTEIKNPYVTKNSKSKNKTSYPELSWKNFGHKCYSEIANTELGLEFKKSPSELRKILGWNLVNIFKLLFLKATRNRYE